jgi:hypothetical protein
MVAKKVTLTIAPEDFTWCKDNSLSLSALLQKAIKEKQNDS